MSISLGSDFKAIKANRQVNANWDCDYVEYSTVPDQTGGSFWSILNRLFISETYDTPDPAVPVSS